MEVKGLTRVKSHLEERVKSVPIPHPVDRKLFFTSWLVLGLAIFAYGVFTIIKSVQSYKSPGAQIAVNPHQPPYPIFAVCFENPVVTPTVLGYWIPPGASGYFLALSGSAFDFSDGTPCVQCQCVQFNTHHEITATNGSVQLYATGKYYHDAPRSIAYLLVRAQALGAFTNISDGAYDVLNLPTGSHVDATWTVTQRITTTQWVPEKTKTKTSYALVQQIEDLTTSTTQSLIQAFPLDADQLACETATLGSSCKGWDDTAGICYNFNDSTQIGMDYGPINACAWDCGSGNQSIPVSMICNGQRDCWNGADEEQSCEVNNCTDGSGSYSVQQKCNGVDDCTDGSDELHCLNLPIIVYAVVSPYSSDVTEISDSVTFAWDVALAAFKSVVEIIIGAMSFLFPAYFLSSPELRRFRLLREAQPEPEQTLKSTSQLEMQSPSRQMSNKSPETSEHPILDSS